MRHAQLAAELIRRLRGRRSQAQLSRRLGYRSNIVQRWETQRCWPTAAEFLALFERSGRSAAASYRAFLGAEPSFLSGTRAASKQGVAAFLGHLRGGTAIVDLATATGFSRFSIGRWLKAEAEPRLPEFLTVIDAASLRLLDYVATLVDPAELPSVAAAWKSLESARLAAYDKPWSHVVLRALELQDRPTAAKTIRWIAERFALPEPAVAEALELLEASGQLERQAGKWHVRDVQAVDTRADAARSRQLRTYWLRVARARLEAGMDGVYGFNLMAVSARDVPRLRELHASYYREMQALVAASEPAERVLLFCTQLMTLEVPGDAVMDVAVRETLWKGAD